MKRGIFLFLLIILLLSAPALAEEGNPEEGESKEPPKLKPGDLKTLGNKELVENYDQIASNPKLIEVLSAEQVGHLAKTKGYKSLKDKGVLNQLNDVQLLDSGILQEQMKKPEGFNVNDISEDLREDVIPEIADIDEYKQTSGNVVLKQNKDGSVSFSAAQASATINNAGGQTAFTDTNGEISTKKNADGTAKTVVKGKSKQITHKPSTPNTGASSVTPPGSGKEPDRDGGQKGKPKTETQTIKDNPPGSGFNIFPNSPTDFTGANIDNFEVNGDEFRADRADNIILSRQQGIIEVSNNVTNFTANSTHFGVGTAESVIVDGIRINGARKAKFSFLVKDGEPYMKLKHKEPSTHIITDKAGNVVKFTSGGDGFLAISLDDSKVKYMINHGKAEFKPDIKNNGESYTETIDAQDSIAEAIIENGNGITYLKTLPPASYIYTPDSIEKTFALQAQHEVHEIFFIKNGARPKNDCQSCTIVDFVENRIKINGQLTYKRYFFKMEEKGPNLMEPTLQSTLVPTNPIYAILDYDKELRFVEMLSIRENKGEFKVIPTNYLQLRFEGKLNEDNVQGEVFAKMKPTSVKQTPTPIFHKIANVGNTAIQYIDDPRSDKKVLAMGRVFFYPMSHSGINPYIDELTRTCVLPAN